MAQDGYRPIGRRAFFGVLGLGAAGIVAGAPVQRTLERMLSPLTDLDSTGITGFLPTSSRFRLYSVVGYNPNIPEADYRLTVGGLVDTELDLDFDELLARPRTELIRDFQCVTGWRVPDVPWAGVRLGDLLDEAGPQPGATHVRFLSYDGVYDTTLTLEQARRDDVLVAYEMEGGIVRREHGGPVRLYVAPMYGYKSLKWLGRIEVTDQPRPEGYWEIRGYDADAWVGRSNGRSDPPT